MMRMMMMMWVMMMMMMISTLDHDDDYVDDDDHVDDEPAHRWAFRSWPLLLFVSLFFLFCFLFSSKFFPFSYFFCLVCLFILAWLLLFGFFSNFSFGRTELRPFAFNFFFQFFLIFFSVLSLFFCCFSSISFLLPFLFFLFETNLFATLFLVWFFFDFGESEGFPRPFIDVWIMNWFF